MRGPGHREDDALGNILGSQRLEARVHGLGGGAIALEADDAELGLDKPGCDLGDANRLAVELEPQRARDGAHGVLHRRVSRASLVCLEARDRSDVDDVPYLRFAQQGQAGARHEHQAEDVHVPHADPVLVFRLFQGLETERAARVVDQHIDMAVPLADFRDEAVDASSFSYVQLEGEP